MSADNWGKCPRCKEVREREYERKTQEVADAYGKLAAEDWIALKRQIEGSEDIDTNTLREDYDIFTDEDGKFEVSYRCSCAKCGFEFGYEYDQQLQVTP